MNAQTQTRTVFENRPFKSMPFKSMPFRSMPFGSALHTVAGQLVERATKVSAQGTGSQVLRWLLAIGVVSMAGFLAWKALRGLKSIFWALFGLGMMLFWTGLWRVWF